MAENNSIRRPEHPDPCITIIGMAGSGKSTLGRALATRLGYAFVDTDQLMESAYGAPLQAITDALSGEEFLDLEGRFVGSLRMGKAVISTGGSVVYRDAAMQHLRSLGPVVALDAPLNVIQQRIALNPDRGLVIAKGQTIADLCNERSALYNKYADIHCDTTQPLEACVESIARELEKRANGN